jgi:hypothetical protein
MTTGKADYHYTAQMKLKEATDSKSDLLHSSGHYLVLIQQPSQNKDLCI